MGIFKYKTYLWHRLIEHIIINMISLVAVEYYNHVRDRHCSGDKTVVKNRIIRSMEVISKYQVHFSG